MTKEIVLVDYEWNRCTYKVENFEKVVLIQVTILSGDEVVEVKYEDGRIIKFDYCPCRIIGFYDGTYIVPQEKIEEWSNTYGDAYVRQRLFG